MRDWIGLRPTRLDAWCGISVFLWIVAMICSVMPSKDEAAKAIVATLPFIAVLGGFLAAFSWSMCVGEQRKKLSVGLFVASSGIALWLYGWSGHFTAYMTPDWAFDFLQSERNSPKGQFAVMEDASVVFMLIMLAIIGLGMASITLHSKAASLLAWGWQRRTKMMIGFVVLMLPAASIYNASVGTSAVPILVSYVGILLGTIAFVPPVLTLAIWLGGWLIGPPVKFMTNGKGRLWKFATVWLVTELVGAGMLYFWLYNRGNSLQEKWIYVTVFCALASLALGMLCFRTVAEDSASSQKDAPQYARFSPACLLPLVLFGYFSFQALWVYDLQVLVLSPPQGSNVETTRWEYAHNRKKLQTVSNRSVYESYPRRQWYLLIHMQEGESLDLKESLKWTHARSRLSFAVLNVEPHVKVACLDSRVVFYHGTLGVEQLHSLQETSIQIRSGVSLPDPPPEDLNLRSLNLVGEPRNMGLAHFLDLYAKDREDGELWIRDVEIDMEVDWPAILRASKRRNADVVAPDLSEEIFLSIEDVSQLPETLSVSGLWLGSPLHLRFGLALLPKTYAWEVLPYESTSPGLYGLPEDVDSATKLKALERVWCYKHDSEQNATAAWIPGGSINWLTQEMPALETLHLELVEPFSEDIGESSWEEPISADSFPSLRSVFFDPNSFGYEEAFLLPFLSNLKNLEELQLGHAPFPGEDLAWVSPMKKLRVIRFFSLPAVELCVELAKLPNLERVEIYADSYYFDNPEDPLYPEDLSL
ncbi:MAG: hypothetical protein AAF483_12300, partial [Planctomycetota bacterium]